MKWVSYPFKFKKLYFARLLKIFVWKKIEGNECLGTAQTPKPETAQKPPTRRTTRHFSETARRTPETVEDPRRSTIDSLKTHKRSDYLIFVFSFGETQFFQTKERNHTREKNKTMLSGSFCVRILCELSDTNDFLST